MKVLILGIGLTVTVLWTYHEARVKTAKFLRFTADFLSPIHRPIEQRNRKRERKKERKSYPRLRNGKLEGTHMGN